MTALKVIGVDICIRTCFSDIFVLSQIGLLIFEAPEPLFNHDIVSPTALAIHTLADPVFPYEIDILVACELAALIRIKNQWICYFKSLFNALMTILVLREYHPLPSQQHSGCTNYYYYYENQIDRGTGLFID